MQYYAALTNIGAGELSTPFRDVFGVAQPHETFRLIFGNWERCDADMVYQQVATGRIQEIPEASADPKNRILVNLGYEVGLTGADIAAMHAVVKHTVPGAGEYYTWERVYPVDGGGFDFPGSRWDQSAHDNFASAMRIFNRHQPTMLDVGDAGSTRVHGCAALSMTHLDQAKKRELSEPMHDLSDREFAHRFRRFREEK